VNQEEDQRELHALRKHIDCLLSSGATIIQRDPLTLAFEGRTLTVQHGMLINDGGFRDLVAAIADHVWPSNQLRSLAIEICLNQLDQAIKASTEGQEGCLGLVGQTGQPSSRDARVMVPSAKAASS